MLGQNIQPVREANESLAMRKNIFRVSNTADNYYPYLSRFYGARTAVQPSLATTFNHQLAVSLDPTAANRPVNTALHHGFGYSLDTGSLGIRRAYSSDRSSVHGAGSANGRVDSGVGSSPFSVGRGFAGVPAGQGPLSHAYGSSSTQSQVHGRGFAGSTGAARIY